MAAALSTNVTFTLKLCPHFPSYIIDVLFCQDLIFKEQGRAQVLTLVKFGILS